jgi:hypothetical protein
MQPIALLSVYLLSQAFLKKNYLMLLVATIVFAFSFTIHFSAIAWLPLFMLFSFLLLKLENKKIVSYIGFVFTFILSVVVFHLPVFVYFINHGFQVGEGIVSKNTSYIYLINYYFNNLTNYFSELIKALFLNNIIILVLVIGLVGFLFMESRKRWPMIIGLAFFLSPIFAASVIDVSRFQLHYLTLSFSSFAIIFSVLVNFYFNKINFMFIRIKNKKISILTIGCWLLLIVFVLTKILPQDFSFSTNLKKRNESHELLKSAVSAIEFQILDIKQKEKLTKPDFFQIISFSNKQTGSDKTTRRKILDPLLLMPLEKKLNFKLARVSDDEGSNFTQTNKDNYVFLACYDLHKLGLTINCTQDFLRTFPNYSVLQRIYTKRFIAIFSLKKRSILF